MCVCVVCEEGGGRGQGFDLNSVSCLFGLILLLLLLSILWFVHVHVGLGKEKVKRYFCQFTEPSLQKGAAEALHNLYDLCYHAVFTYQLHNRDKGDEVEHGTKTNKVAQVSISTAAPAILHLRIQNHCVHMRK